MSLGQARAGQQRNIGQRNLMASWPIRGLQVGDDRCVCACEVSL